MGVTHSPVKSTATCGETVDGHADDCRICKLRCPEEPANSVQCSFCDGWMHYDCLEFPGNYSQQTMQRICKNIHVMMICPPCKAVSAEKSSCDAAKIPLEIPKIVEALQSQINAQQLELQKQLAAQKLEIQSQFQDMAKTVECLVTAVQGTVVGEGDVEEEAEIEGGRWSEVLSRRRKKDVAPAVAIGIRNANEEEARKRSLVFSNLPEKGTDDNDVKEICRIIDNSAVPLFAYRLGVKKAVRRGEEGGVPKPRLVKVVFQSSSVAKSVLINKRALGGSNFRNVFIRPSMTPEERKFESDLRKECAARNTQEAFNKGEKFVVIGNQMVHFVNCQVIPTANGGSRLGHGVRAPAGGDQNSRPPSGTQPPA